MPWIVNQSSQPVYYMILMKIVQKLRSIHTFQQTRSENHTRRYERRNSISRGAADAYQRSAVPDGFISQIIHFMRIHIQG